MERRKSIVEGISEKQIQAWDVFNSALKTPGFAMYLRVTGHELYREDMHERIVFLFTQLDEQNKLLDSILTIKKT